MNLCSGTIFRLKKTGSGYCGTWDMNVNKVVLMQLPEMEKGRVFFYICPSAMYLKTKGYQVDKKLLESTVCTCYRPSAHTAPEYCIVISNIKNDLFVTHYKAGVSPYNLDCFSFNMVRKSFNNAASFCCFSSRVIRANARCSSAV